MFTLKLTQIGNSVGVILPKEVLAKLRVGKGDVIHITESPDGYRITPHSVEFEAQIESCSRNHERAPRRLRELAR